MAVVRNTFLEFPEEDEDQPMPLPSRPRAQTDQLAMPRKVKYRQEEDNAGDDNFGFADDGVSPMMAAGDSSSPYMYRSQNSNTPNYGNMISTKTPTPHVGYGDAEFGVPAMRTRSGRSNKHAGGQRERQQDPFGQCGGAMVPPYGFPPMMGFPPYMYPGGAMPGMPGFPPMPGMPPFMAPPMMGPGGVPMMPPFPGMQMPDMEAAGSRRSRANSGMSGGKSPKGGANHAAAVGGGRGAGRGSGGSGRGAGGRGAAGPTQGRPPTDGPEVPENATTVMLRNIPNRYSQGMLLALLDEKGFMGAYDFVYLPMDFRHSVNLGYAFVNLVTHESALQFRETFDGFCTWSVESAKTGEVSWANPHQGLAENVERYRNSPVMHPSMPEEYKPMIFQNGVRQIFPPSTKALRAPKLRPANERATPQPQMM